MIKKRYILVLAAVILIPVIYFITVNAGSTVEEPEEVEVADKVFTKIDSLVFKYDSLLNRELEKQGTVGAAIAIIYKGEIIHLKCFGVKESGGNDSIDAHTLFRLASVSKTMTGVLAGIMSEEGTIGLDDKVVDYLPDFKLKDSVNTADLSIRNILSHTSGLVPHAYDNLVEADVPFSIIIDSLQRVNISDVPGKLYGYQNVVFSLYDTIATVKTSKSFAGLMREKVFIPFGMRDACVGFMPFEVNPNKALPHNGHRVLSLNDRYYNTNPAAGINASISDLGNFLVALSGNDSTLLAPGIANTVLSPQVVSPLRRVYLRKWNGVESKHYGIGWRIIGYKGHQVAYHGGYVRGYRAEIALCRDEEIGIAFLTNSPGSVGSISIPMFLDMYFDLLEAPSTVQ